MNTTYTNADFNMMVVVGGWTQEEWNKQQGGIKEVTEQEIKELESILPR